MKKQQSFTDLEYSMRKRKTKRDEFLETMDAITPWDEIVAMIEPYYYKNHLGRRPRGIEVMFRMYLLATWFNLSDEAVEDAIYDSYAMRKFMGLDFTTESVPDATTLCKFRKLINDNGLGERYFAACKEFLEQHGRMMHGGTIVDATIIDAPSSTKNADGKRDPDYPAYKIKPFDIVRIRRSNEPYALLRIGQPGYFSSPDGRNARLGEVYNIHATNLHMHMGCVILANVTLENCYFGNIFAGNDVDYIFTTKELRTQRVYGADLKNVVFENVFYKNEDNDFGIAFDLIQKDQKFTAENVLVRNAFLENCKTPFFVNYGSIRYSGVFGKHVERESGVLVGENQ